MPKPTTKTKKKPARVHRVRQPVAELDSPGMTPKMELFVAHYVSNGWNGTRAAIAAGYTAGKKNTSAAVQASKLLILPKVRAAINAKLKQFHLSRDQVLARLGEVANANIADLTDDEGNVEWKKVQQRGHLVKKRKLVTRTDEDGNSTSVCELELHDSLKALELIGKHHGLFRDQLDVTSDGEKLAFVPLTVDPKLVTGEDSP